MLLYLVSIPLSALLASLIFVSVLYFHFGIDGWEDLIREVQILRYKVCFARSQGRVRRQRVNYMGTWRGAVARWGDELFLQKDNASFTYKQIDELSDNVGRFLFEKGVSDHSIVGIMMTNSIEFVVSWFAVVKLGARPALLNSNLRGSSLVHCVRALNDCRFMLLNEETECSLSKETPLDYKLLRITVFKVSLLSKEYDKCIIGEKALSLMGLLSDEEQPGKWAGNDKEYDSIVGFLFTSGTTGLPKAVPFAFNRLWSVIQICFIQRYKITQSDKIYSALPLYHSTALCIGLHTTILSGGSFVIKDKLSVQQFWNDMKKYDATIFLYVGEMCRFLLNRKGSYRPSLEYKTRLCIGNGLGKDIYSDFKETFKLPQVAEFYGQTECFAFLGSVLNKPGSLGYIPKIKIGPHPYRVIQCDIETLQPIREYHTGFCKLCDMNQPGLLIVKFANVGKRTIYHKANQDVRFLCDVIEDGDEFINTGDLVLIGSDRSYYFVDRLGDTFRWRGENVSTQEVAAVINKLDWVQECCVFGVTVPGHCGRAGMAALVVESESDDEFSMSDLYHLLYQNLPRYAVPVFLRLLHSLETTSTFKYMAGQLKQDGFDINVSTNMFILDNSDKTYKQITVEDFETLQSGHHLLK